MKKFLLLVAVAMTAFCQMNAQDMSIAYGATIEKVSEDGRYAVFTNEGTLYLLDTKTTNESEQVTVFEADEMTGIRYSIGFGHIFADDNTMVGGTTDATPAILKNGEWTLLPIQEKDAEPGKINSADAITPDGSRICGGIAMSAMSIDAKDPMLVPVVWDKQADGSYGMYTILPYPKTDFTGSVPQYVTARDMSADGKTIIGQITDCSGFYTYPIVYRQDAEGKWSYELFLEEMVYDPKAEFLPFPVYDPTCPYAEDYLDAAGLAAYEAAVQAYNDSLEQAYVTFDNWPSYYPEAKDFLTGENKDIFDALFSKYEEENHAYLDSLNAYQDCCAEHTTGSIFEFNISYLSPDGKYVAMTYVKPADFFFDPDENFVCRYNFDTKETQMSVQQGSACNITSDGSVLFASPYNNSMWQRTAHVMRVGGTECVPLETYIRSKSAKAAEFFTEVMTFEMLQFDPDTYMPMEETDTIVLSGTPSCNSDGSVICGWSYNEGNVVDTEEWDILGYIIDLRIFDDYTSIKTAAINNKVTSMVITDLNGVVVSNNGSLKGLNKGVYLVNTTTADGKTKTIKVMKK